jgi:hypothetical protein
MAASQQVAVVVSRQTAEEAALLAVLAPHRPLARANRFVSSLMMTRYLPMRTSLCRSSYDGSPVPLGRAGAGLPPPRLMWLPWWRLRTRRSRKMLQRRRRLTRRLPIGALRVKSVCPPRFFVAMLHFEYISFSHSSSSSRAATAMGAPAPAAGTTTAEVVVGLTPGPATSGEPQTPKGVLEYVLEESEEELEMVAEPVSEVVQGEVPSEGAMIATSVATPPHPMMHQRRPHWLPA